MKTNILKIETKAIQRIKEVLMIQAIHFIFVHGFRFLNSFFYDFFFSKSQSMRKNK